MVQEKKSATERCFSFLLMIEFGRESSCRTDSANLNRTHEHVEQRSETPDVW